MSDSNLKIQIDAEEIASQFGDLKYEVEEALTEAVRQASVMAYGIANELAAEKLNSRLKTYQDALSYEEVSPGLWTVSLDESAFWIEDGISAHDQRETLLKNNAKVSKDGTRYKVIPFEHSKNPSQQTSRAREISQMVKKELKARNIPYKKIERDEKGSPRLGKLHSFSVPGSPKPSPKAKFGALSGINIYQRMEKGRAVRDIMTFRTITSKKDDRWMHPGLQAEKILDQTFDKIQQIFDLEILPEVLRKYSAFER